MAQILVIDDEQVMTNAVRDILQLDGHQILTAPDGRAGMVLFDANPIDIVITDMLMPGQGGVEVIRQIQSRLRNTKLVAMTGVDQVRLIEMLKTSDVFGVDATLMKPFSLQALLDVVKKVLDG
jgi:two-component system, response regulator, stage 0 sporulation protein F